MCRKHKKIQEQIQSPYINVIKTVWYITFYFKNDKSVQYGFETKEDMEKYLEQVKKANWETDKYFGEYTIISLKEVVRVEFGDYQTVVRELRENKENDNGE